MDDRWMHGIVAASQSSPSPNPIRRSPSPHVPKSPDSKSVITNNRRRSQPKPTGPQKPRAPVSCNKQWQKVGGHGGRPSINHHHVPRCSPSAALINDHWTDSRWSTAPLPHPLHHDLVRAANVAQGSLHNRSNLDPRGESRRVVRTP